MTSMQLEAATIAKIDPRDGDLLVLTTGRHLPDCAIRRSVEALKAALAEIGVKAKVVVLWEGMDLKVVRTSDLVEHADAA
jgi:hypothetical protein